MKAILIAMSFLLLSSSVDAVCLKGNPSVKQECDDSQSVFIGKVQEQRHVPESRDYYDGDEYIVQVLEVFKGESKHQIVIFSENSSGRFPMTVGSTYILFVYVERGRFQVSNCGNSGLLSDKKDVVSAVWTLRSQIALPLDLEKEKQLQAEVDKGHQPWRLEPVEVARAALIVGLDSTVPIEKCSLLSKTDHEAIVKCTDSKDFTVTLKQLIRPKGIWTATDIRMRE
jgi:hypothetical protein